jgi:hypothetical protein
MSTRRKRLLLRAGIPLAVLAVVVLVAGRGGVTTAGAEERPDWSAPCWTQAPRGDRRLLARCARLSGRVLWVRRQGLGPASKAQLIVVARFKPYVVKIAPVATGRRLPAIGHRLTVVGPLVASRAGLPEVQDFGAP